MFYSHATCLQTIWWSLGHHPNLVKVHFVLMWKICSRSGHNFAHFMTAQLSWHVHNYDLIRSWETTSEKIAFPPGLHYEIINHSWNCFLDKIFLVSTMFCMSDPVCGYRTYPTHIRLLFRHAQIFFYYKHTPTIFVGCFCNSWLHPLYEFLLLKDNHTSIY